jgi:hypothetical protein
MRYVMYIGTKYSFLKVGSIYKAKKFGNYGDLLLIEDGKDTRIVFSSDVLEMIPNTKLNRVLYPDYKIIGDYLCQKPV